VTHGEEKSAADRLERVRAGLEGLVGRAVKLLSRSEWDEKLRAGGEPTRLQEPPGPFLGVQGVPGFEYAVTNGAPHAPEGGIHLVRIDANDPPEERVNTDSHVVIEDLMSQARWPEVLLAAGLESSPDLEGLVRAHVFAYLCQREDHHGPSIPKDIADAIPKGQPR